MIIDTDQLYKCETCSHHKYYGCNTYCDHGESYTPDYSKLKPVDLKALGYVKLEGKPQDIHTLLVGSILYIQCPKCSMHININGQEDRMFVTCPNCGEVIKKFVRGAETL